ncbi:fumarylacetoacetate hydrolase domain-containing protein 2 [Parachaetomium inaequale]|uniref:Fumarylacetoacetate hydrolase domain-containing protein 2 n=1 Tax=Parachaetomium inaequale TaxID=2588326 RepID=A0AAN6PB17_9PEZI|nr:fumarylacetoacetate hydrolase domain-containing protein 2 [Parachaetomium inaequale]
MSFQRLVRFVNAQGTTSFGDLKSEPTGDLAGAEVEVLEGDIEKGFRGTGRTDKIEKLLCPLPSVPLVICIGLNYQKHATEANLRIPPYPVVFTKPADALAGPLDAVSIHPDAQGMLDYEGELTVVMGRDAKNVNEAEALQYVLGYTVGNDVSARNFQLPDTSGGQFCYAKSFDGFAPIGPCIAAPGVVGDPQKLRLVTRVNGEVRQETETSDMIFSVARIIAHLSRGTTLRKGTVIQTGTPSGVGLFMEPKGFLKDGDVVEVAIDGIGAIRNKMVFE